MSVSLLYAGLTSPVVNGGGSGGPSGDGQIWIRADFAALDALTGITDGDLGVTEDTGFQYVREAGVWAFWRGSVLTTANLPDVADPIITGAIASVGNGSAETYVQYVFDGSAWDRSPLDSNYLWPETDVPGSLQEIAVVDGDRQKTTSPDRLWERVSGAWKIRQATESLASSLPTVDVITGALGFVGTAGYVWGGASWSRTGVTLNQPYARTLSSLQDVLTTDLDGDYGLFNGVSLRLKRSISLPGGGTANLWVPPVVYAGTITARAYLTGTESNTGLSTTLANQGWTVSTSGAGGSINTTAAPGFVRITDSSTASSSASLGVTAFASGGIAPSTKFYLQGGFRVPVSTTAAYLATVRDATNYWSLFQVAAGLTVGTDTNNPPTALATTLVRGGATALPTSGAASVLEVIDEGATVYTMVRRDGSPYVGTRRNIAASGAASNLFIGDISTATTGVTVDAQNLYVLTWV